MSKSVNGGDSWSPLTTLTREDGAATVSFVDKESITADPFDSNYVYAVWDRGRIPTDRANINALHAFSFRGDIWFSRTTNGGASWEPARAIFAPRESKFSIGNQIVVLPNGDLVDVMFLGHGSGRQRSGWDVAVVRSTDRGDHWQEISPDLTTNDAGKISVPRGLIQFCTITTISESPAQAGVIWVGTDDGTWSAPTQVNQFPSVQAFTPAVEVASDGTVGVTYYDFRNNDSDPATLPTDYWLVHSHDGGATFGDEAHLAGSFDMKNAPNAGGFFVGDYEGLATIGNTFVPVFVQTNPGNTTNRTDVFQTTASP